MHANDRLKIDLQRIDDCVQSQVDPEPFSGVVSLTQGDHVLFEKAYGFAIRSESIPNRTNTRFQTASGCKIFTSVAICQLVEQGQLSFDTPLRECTDISFPFYDANITIHHLLTHSSGITSYFEQDVNDDYEALWQDLPMYKVRGPRDFLPLFQHKKMLFPPGERFDYNDGGFILLGIVIESLTGTRFADYIEAHIFGPAGMQDSGYFPTDQLPERTAYAYIKNPDGTLRTNFFAVPIVGAPDGGAYTSAPDMSKFWKALRNNKLLTSATTVSLLKPHTTTSWKAPYTHYGYGVWVDKAEGSINKFFVEGSDPGVALRSAVYPDQELVFTMIGNTGAALWSLYRDIEALGLGRRLNQAES